VTLQRQQQQTGVNAQMQNSLSSQNGQAVQVPALQAVSTDLGRQPMRVFPTVASIMVAAWVILQGCTHLTATMANAQKLEGRDVDEVIADLKNRGYLCGDKAKNKVFNSQEMVGVVSCAIREAGFLCPESYRIFMSFDLVTSKVRTSLKDSRTNCF